MITVIPPPAPVPELPPYEPDQSMSLGAACRLGLIPGHDGRRASPAEVRTWARTGFAVGPVGPRYLFPAVRSEGDWRTTIAWCSAWVQFIADAIAEGRSQATEPVDDWDTLA